MDKTEIERNKTRIFKGLIGVSVNKDSNNSVLSNNGKARNMTEFAISHILTAKGLLMGF